MIINRLRDSRRHQGGFTLIELLVVVCIVGALSTPLGIAVGNMITVPKQNTDRMTVVKQVENAIHWITRDVQMAQSIQPGGAVGFPLVLTWTDWDNTVNQVTYSLENEELKRSLNSGSPMVVAQYINPDAQKTKCDWMPGTVFNLTITADIAGSKPATESRVIQIVPRTKQ
jgi:prepilin-type N-terminal cleavage/methylation domain-containing protein